MEPQSSGRRQGCGRRSPKAANQYLLEVERFSKLLLGESVPRWPIEDSLDTLRTIEAIFESARTGQWQALR
jgi:predicted dehydrogenase